jgi:sugar/nucleoside kinase (ribokinase family)
MTDLEVLALGSALVELTPTELGASLAEASQYEALPSGAAANFCVALAKLGCRVALATRVGEDELGQWLRARLEGYGVDMSLARAVPGQYTPVSFCWMDQDGAKAFYFYRFPGYSDPMAEFGREPLSDDGLRRARLFDFSEATVRAEPLRSVSLELARRARGLGLQVCYAVNYRANSWREPPEQVVAVQREALALADIAVMNREEAALITGEADPKATALLDLGPGVVAVTGGAEGSWIAAEGVLTHVPACEVEVRYDIGAGDTFHAGLLAGLLKGMGPVAAAGFGSCAAGLRICRAADMSCLPTWEEVAEFSAKQSPV